MDSKGASFVILVNDASTAVRKKRLKHEGRPPEIRLWEKKWYAKRETKALEKSIVARIVEEPGLGLLKNQKYTGDGENPAPINSRLVVVRSPTLFGLNQNGCWPSRIPVTPGIPLEPFFRHAAP